MLVLLTAADVLMQDMSGFEEKQLDVDYIALQFLHLFTQLGQVSLQSLVFVHLLGEFRLQGFELASQQLAAFRVIRR